MALPDYAVVSPVKDECEYLPLAAESLMAQTHRPMRWIIVDDGSRDGTRALAEQYASQEPWITVVGSEPSERRSRGAPIVRAFERGRRVLNDHYEFIVKLDGDLFLPAHYFAWVAETFAREPRAGIAGGRVFVHNGCQWVPERVGGHTVHGALKAYRTSCLDDIGGLHETMGWDGIDEYGARARGWRVFPLSELHVLHYRRRGAREPWWRARFEEGQGAYHMGYLPRVLVLRAAYRMLVETPPLVGGLALLAGWIWGRLARAPLVADPLAIATLRLEQRRRLRGLALGRTRVPPDVPVDGGPANWAREHRT